MTADDAGAFPEEGHGPAPSVPEPRFRAALRELWQGWRRSPAGRHHGHGLPEYRREQWRAWRRSRPFWGGLLLVLAGLELFALPLSGDLFQAAVRLVIYIGIGGVFGVLIGALLVAAGLVVWFNPTHKTFYGIAGVVLGIASFPASNLGGLFIGMLLAIIGGALAYAWTPAEEPLT